MKIAIKIIFTIPFFLFLFSCASDCNQEQIEQAEWVMRYENYSIDTLASYSIVQNYISSQIKGVTNSSKYKSNNNTYDYEKSILTNLQNKILEKYLSNDTKIYSSTYKDYTNDIKNVLNGLKNVSNNITRIIEIRNNSDFTANFAIRDNNDFFNQTEYRSVQPHGTTIFRLSRSIYWNNNSNSDFTSDLIVLQNKQKIKQTRRIDELHLSTITVNTCEKSAEAEQAKYDAIKEQYLQKVDKGKQIIIKKQ
jgi:hypothetical protein